MTLLLREADVDRLVTMRDTIEALDAALRAQGAGQATNEPRRRVRVPGGTLHVMSAALPAQGELGFKAYTGFRPRTRFMEALLDSTSGALLALIEADRLGQLRTGAATGVATRYMARQPAPGASLTLGCFGAGYQAETQVEAICAVRSIGAIRVYSPTPAKREQFAARLSARLGVPVTPVAQPAGAAAADILVTASTAREPVLEADQVAPGTHINAVGSNMLGRRELPDALVGRADRVVVDSREQARLEATDLVAPIERGLLYWERVAELREVVAGTVPGRGGPDEITLFKSLGLALEDVAAGALVYRRALEQQAGEQVRFLD